MPKHVDVIGVGCRSTRCEAVVLLLFVRFERDVLSPDFLPVRNVQALKRPRFCFVVGTRDEQQISPCDGGRMPYAGEVDRPVVVVVRPFDRNGGRVADTASVRSAKTIPLVGDCRFSTQSGNGARSGNREDNGSAYPKHVCSCPGKRVENRWSWDDHEFCSFQCFLRRTAVGRSVSRRSIRRQSRVDSETLLCTVLPADMMVVLLSLLCGDLFPVW